MAALPHSDEAPIDLCKLWLGLDVGGSGLDVGGHGLPCGRSWAALWVAATVPGVCAAPGVVTMVLQWCCLQLLQWRCPDDGRDFGQSCHK